MKNVERVIWAFALAIILFMLFRSCNKDTGVGKVTIETIVKTDTLEGKTDTSYVPTIIHDTIVGRDTIYEENLASVPTEYGTKDDTATPQVRITKYRDTLSFGDSVGYAVVIDSVAGAILKRKFEFSILQKTKTIEITKEVFPKKKSSFYFGGETMLPLKTLSVTNIYIGAALLLKTKREEVYKISFGRFGSSNYGGFSYFKKIN